MSEVLDPRMGQIRELESLIRDLPGHFTGGDNEYVQTNNYWAPGIYARTLFRKAGIILVGKRHRQSCLTVLLRGHLVVTSSTEDVPDGQHIYEGEFWISLPGTKRATYAMEDSLLMTVHPNPTNTQDLAELEEMIILPDTELLK